jgi:hypothetical protein
MTYPTGSAPSLTPSTQPPFSGLWLKDLRGTSQNHVSWLWHGYLAPGSVTLLTSQWKSGKTTLISVLMDRLKAGGTLADLPVAPARAVIVSEESPMHWYRRSQKLSFGDHLCWFCRPFRGKPRPDEWLALLDHVLDLRGRHDIGLLVIDPLASFMSGHNENGAGGMLAALLPLQQLTSQGMAVLVAHHPRKGEIVAGQAARGSGALSGYVDIIMEMSWYDHPCKVDRRRKVQAFSRFEETPRGRIIELTPDGTDYLSHGDFEEEELNRSRALLLDVLDDADHKLTRKEVLAAWPVPPVPEESTLWRHLDRLVTDEVIRRDGEGRRHHPFRYWLPAREEEWRKNPLYALEEAQREALRQLDMEWGSEK